MPAKPFALTRLQHLPAILAAAHRQDLRVVSIGTLLQSAIIST